MRGAIPNKRIPSFSSQQIKSVLTRTLHSAGDSLHPKHSSIGFPHAVELNLLEKVCLIDCSLGKRSLTFREEGHIFPRSMDRTIERTGWRDAHEYTASSLDR
jgi:hypothetical protein